MTKIIMIAQYLWDFSLIFVKIDRSKQLASVIVERRLAGLSQYFCNNALIDREDR